MTQAASVLWWTILAASYGAAGCYKMDLVMRYDPEGDPCELTTDYAVRHRLTWPRYIALGITLSLAVALWPLSELYALVRRPAAPDEITNLDNFQE